METNTIKKSGKTVAFTGDSAINDNIMVLMENADEAFVDATGSSFIGISNAHFAIEELAELREKAKHVLCQYIWAMRCVDSLKNWVSIRQVMATQ